MSDLPLGWVEIELGAVADVSSGAGFPLHLQGEKAGDLGFYKVGDISRAVANHRGKLTDAQHYVSLATAKELRAKPIPAGATVFAKIGEAIKLNRRARVVTPCLVDNNVMAVKALLPESDSYLYWYLRTQEFGETSRSTTVPSLRKGDIESLLLPLPPLKEQTRISGKLDLLVLQVEACRERLDRIPQILKKFREAVLEAAVSGRLTEEWRAARCSHAHIGAFLTAEPPDGAGPLPPSWNWHAIGDLSVKVSDGVHKKPEYLPAGVPFITVKDLTAGPGIDFSNTRFISQADHDDFIRRTHPEKGDLLISKDGTLGVIRLIDTDRPFSIFVSVALIKLKDKSMTEYMRIALEAPVVQKQMVGVGSGLQHIHLQDLRKDVVPLPPSAEQNEIVRRVAHLFALADNLSRRYEDVVAGVESLAPSVLAKAFRGELLPQDPNDEPAEQLLARIRQGQAGDTSGVEPGRKPVKGCARGVKTGGGRRLGAESGARPRK